MAPENIAALVAAQAPAHVECRAQEFVEFDGIDSKMVVQCSCNVRLTLTIPKAADPSLLFTMTVSPGGEISEKPAPITKKGDRDVS